MSGRITGAAASEHQRAAGFGAFFVVSGSAALLASLGAGLIWDRSGPAATFEASAVVAAIAAAMLILLPKREVAA